MSRLLLIEDDLPFLRLLTNFLGKHGHSVVSGTSVKDAIKALGADRFDAALLDYRLPDGTGLDILDKINRYVPGLPVIIMTSFNDVRTAVKAIQTGARDYILKPIHHEELLIQLSKILTVESNPQGTLRPATALDHIEGISPLATKLYEHVRLVAPTNLSVIIQGESGTGKEFVARMIHTLSPRAAGPFVAVDCGVLNGELASSALFGHVKGAFTGAVTDATGLFQQANTGTLFLDEIGNLPYEVQVKLLRTIQERSIQRVGSGQTIPVDVRLIVATNDTLPQQVKDHAFREDLYHRLHEFDITVPSLRERKEDISIFADLFRNLANKELGKSAEQFSPEVVGAFLRYSWPGNLRELKNLVRRAVLFSQGKVIDGDAIPREMFDLAHDSQEAGDHSFNLKSLQEVKEKEVIHKTLLQVGFNKSKAARLLHIDRKTLYMKIRKYDLEP